MNFVPSLAKMVVSKSGDIGTASCWLPKQYIGKTVYVYPELHHDMKHQEWSDAQIIELMSVGLRHAEFKNGGPTVEEIRQGLRAAAAKG